MKHRPESRAFTLIELLVVVAIIIALLAILLPAMGNAIAVAEAATCGSNLNQIHIGWMGYAQDNHGHLATEQKWIEQWHPGDNSAWAHKENVENGQIFKYLGETYDVYICPTFDGLYQSDPAHAGKTAAATYSISMKFTERSWIWGTEVNQLSQIRSASSVLLIADENPWANPPYSNHGINDLVFLTDRYVPLYGAIDGIGSFHNPPGGDIDEGNSNVLFPDGHVAQHHVSEYKDLIFFDDR